MSRRGFLRILAVPALVLGLATGQALNAFAAVLIHQDVPFTDPVTNTCVPELVVTTNGVFHMLFTVTVGASGTLHFDTLDNTADVHGVGAVSSANYSISETFHDILNIGPGEEIDSIQQFHYVSAGNTPDFMFHMNVHITITPNGVPTADATNIHTSC